MEQIVPLMAVILLSPVLTELLMDALRVSSLWLLIPEMPVYRVAALLIREAVRQQRSGWGAVLLLGIAFALVVECVILRTSLTPQFFTHDGGHILFSRHLMQKIIQQVIEARIEEARTENLMSHDEDVARLLELGGRGT